MKKIILFSIALLSFQTAVSAMMRSPHYEQELKEHKDSNSPVRAHLRSVKAEAYAQKEMKNRTPVVTSQIALKIYDKLNKHWTYPLDAQNRNLQVESPYWIPKWGSERTLLGGKQQQANGAQLILQCDPHQMIEALEDLIHTPAALECTVASTAVRLFTLKELLGAEDFTTYAVKFYNALKTTSGWSVDQFFHKFPLQFMEKMDGQAKPVSMVYLTNLSDYKQCKPFGRFAGENVVCTGYNQYVGFGDMYKKGPLPLEAIEAECRREFCREDNVEEFHEKHQKLAELFAKNPEAFVALRREEQEENYNFHFVFDAELLQEFKRTKEIHL